MLNRASSPKGTAGILHSLPSKGTSRCARGKWVKESYIYALLNAAVTSNGYVAIGMHVGDCKWAIVWAIVFCCFASSVQYLVTNSVIVVFSFFVLSCVFVIN